MTIKSPPVELPVPIPACIIKSPPAVSEPIASSPLSVAFIGDVLASALPKIILRFFITIVLSFVTVSDKSNGVAGLAVTFASVLIVNDVALNVAPTTGQLPSKLVTVLLAMLIVSPALMPSVAGV